MLFTTRWSLVFSVLAFALGGVTALKDEEKSNILSALIPFISKCNKEYHMTESDIKSEMDAANTNPCIIMCIMTEIELLDDKGNFNTDKAQQLAMKYLSNPEDIALASEIIDTCASVKDQDPENAENGCHTAKLLFECALPYKEKFSSTH